MDKGNIEEKIKSLREQEKQLMANINYVTGAIAALEHVLSEFDKPADAIRLEDLPKIIPGVKEVGNPEPIENANA